MLSTFDIIYVLNLQSNSVEYRAIKKYYETKCLNAYYTFSYLTENEIYLLPKEFVSQIKEEI